MAESRFGVGENDKDRILNFVNELEKFLEEIIRTDGGNNSYFISDLYPSMLSAWEMQRNHFRKIKAKIGAVSIENLERHGLLGSELEFKFSGINYLWSDFSSFTTLSDEEVERKLLPLFWPPMLIRHPRKLYLRWLLKTLLEAIDKVLPSILDAIGASGAVAEFKGFMESSIDLNNMHQLNA